MQSQLPASRRPKANFGLLTRIRTPSGPREMKSRFPSNSGSNPPADRGLHRAGHSYPNRSLTPYVSSSDDDSEETLYSSSPEPKKVKLPHEMRKSKPMELPPPSPETERLWQEGVPFARWAEYLNCDQPSSQTSRRLSKEAGSRIMY